MQKTGANANILSCLDTPITQNIKKHLTSEVSNTDHLVTLLCRKTLGPIIHLDANKHTQPPQTPM